MKAIEKLLPQAVGRDEVVRTALANRALRHWPEIVGDELARRSAPERYDRGTVWIAVEGSAWAQELRLAKPQILARLRSRVGDPSVFENLRFGVRAVTPVPPVAPREEAEPRPDDGSSIRAIAEARLGKWGAPGA